MFLLLKYRAKTLTVVRTHSRNIVAYAMGFIPHKDLQYKSFTFKFPSIRTFSIVKNDNLINYNFNFFVYQYHTVKAKR